MSREVRGFFVMCHRTSKSYYVQHDIAGQSVMVNLGRVDTTQVKDARKLAMSAIVRSEMPFLAKTHCQDGSKSRFKTSTK